MTVGGWGETTPALETDTSEAPICAVLCYADGAAWMAEIRMSNFFRVRKAFF